MATLDACPACGAALPSGVARFCIECGAALAVETVRLAEETSTTPPAATGATVRLANANVEQSVLGGTIKLPTDLATPPGLWMLDQPPGANDTVAVYVPLRAIVDGWSGLIDTGWQLVERLAPERGSTSPRFRFEALCTWFPASGCGQGMWLMVTVGAEAEAQEGRSRRGFRYRTHYDPPMLVRSVVWNDASGKQIERPLPTIQLMAPPRIPRISDLSETIQILPAEKASAWAKSGQITETFHLLQERQQRTPAGRGLVLGSVASLGLFERFFDRSQPRYYLCLKRPLRCTWREWERLQATIASQARDLGLGMETDATIEWWLDREGYDGVVFEDVAARYRYRRVAIAFRRAQIVKVEG